MSDPKKILIAEDEVHIAMAVKAILKKGVPDYVIDHAKNGAEAWDMATSNKYRLIISDWNMPKKNGDELLVDLRNHRDTANIPFIMLSARGDRDSYEAAIKAGANDYVVKPFKTPEFIAKVKGLLETDALNQAADVAQEKCLIDLVVDKFKQGDANLPVLPEIVMKLNELFETDDMKFEELARVIEMDPAIAIKLISIANSPLVRGSSDCLSVERAIMRLGLDETKNYAIALSNKGMLVSDNKILKQVLDKLWWHSLETAYCAKLLARKLNSTQADKMFLLGLLHDVGKLLLVRIIDDLSKSLSEIDEIIVEEVMGKLHSGFGSVLIKSWKFGDEFQNVVRFHHAPFDSEDVSFELLVIYLANLIIDGVGKDMEGVVNISSSQAAVKLGVTNDMIMTVVEEANECMVSVRKVL